MRFVVQRVSSACVQVDQETVGEIGNGYLVLMGVCESDTRAEAEKLVQKLLKLRIFSDAQGKTNLSLSDVGGEILLVSQFTLYADCRKGNRPSFTRAGSADHAKELYRYAQELIRDAGVSVACGVFGAHMEVSLVNDGPFTVLLDSDEL